MTQLVIIMIKCHTLFMRYLIAFLILSSGCGQPPDPNTGETTVCGYKIRRVGTNRYSTEQIPGYSFQTSYDPGPMPAGRGTLQEDGTYLLQTGGYGDESCKFAVYAF